MTDEINKEHEQDIPEEVSKRVRSSLALHWFRYVQACKDPAKKAVLIRQYNQIATGRYRDV